MSPIQGIGMLCAIPSPDSRASPPLSREDSSTMPLATDIRAEQQSAGAMSDGILSGRVESIDFMRGLVMVIMAIDHTRDYFTHLTFEPENLSQTWMALFLTRWITHFCAPLFFFLAGTGAFYYGRSRT